jgi:hypothetical protein
VVRPPNIPTNSKWLAVFSAEVNTQLPVENFYIPEK